MEKKFTPKEKSVLARVFDYLNPKIWSYNSTATVSIAGQGHYFIKKVENGYRYKWVDANTIVAMKDNSPLLFIDDLEKINGGYTGGAF